MAIIIHVDMDAFFAAVEIHDDPSLRGQPLIIGALPGERGVVATASYATRRFGVHSGMNIRDAYALCPQGVYRHPDFDKYRLVSNRLHAIWERHADVIEAIALDEAYLDVTRTAGSFARARQLAQRIKQETLAATGLTCSVGLGYSKASAKIASEENKPDGYFEIPDKEAFLALATDRNIRILRGVGAATADKLRQSGLVTVRDIQKNRGLVMAMLGKQGRFIADQAMGIDERSVSPRDRRDAKSIGREMTFQRDAADLTFLQEVLLLEAADVARRLHELELACRTVTLKLTYGDMTAITRARQVTPTDQGWPIFCAAREALLETARRPVRLIGVSAGGITRGMRQLTLDEAFGMAGEAADRRLLAALETLSEKYGLSMTGVASGVKRQHLSQLVAAMAEANGIKRQKS